MNIYDFPNIPLSEELTTVLAESSNVRIERIISTGQTSDWYDQSETEFVVLLEGNAIIEYDDSKSVTLSKGDTLLIKPHERHKWHLPRKPHPVYGFACFMSRPYTYTFYAKL